ncbi:MAG: NAD-dependent epimerase/dehydratase family protein [Chloroflexota bacterium]
MKKTALIAGATGVAGYSLTHHLANQTDWHVIAIARDCSNLSHLADQVTLIESDLNNLADLEMKLRPYSVSYLFYTAWVNPPGGIPGSEENMVHPMKLQRQLAFTTRWIVPQLKRSRRLHDVFYRGFARASGNYDPENRNRSMLKNITDVLEQPPHQLEHVALLTGGKFYGMHMGPGIYPGFKIPFTEDQPSHPGFNIYAASEEYVQNELDQPVTWSIVRPTFIIGQSPKPSQNIGYGLAIYAWLMKASGQKLVFPAGWKAYRAIGQYSDASLLAQMMTWSAKDPAATNQIFNLVNGDVVSWEQIWPWLGEYFDMEIAIPDEGADLNVLLADRKSAWKQICEQHQLPHQSLESVFSGNFLAASVALTWDAEYSMEKARRHGFESSIATEQMFSNLFGQLEADQIIPPKPTKS